MCRKYPRRCTRRAQTKTTDIARPTCPTGTGARSARKPRSETLAHKHNAGDRASKHVPVIATDYMYLKEMTDETNNPMLVGHHKCSEGVRADCTKKKGDSAHGNNKIASEFRSLKCSKTVIKSDQETPNRSMERNFV